MPRKTKAEGAAPRAPRARKKNSAGQEPAKPLVEPTMYDPMMGMNGMNGVMMDDSNMYGHHPPPDYGYSYGQGYGQDAGTSNPYMMHAPQPQAPAQNPGAATPQPGQPSMMRNQMATNAASQSGVGIPPTNAAQPGQQAPLTPMPSPLEYRIHDINRRLQTFNNSQISEKDYAQWWDAFSHEFFDDEARLTVSLYNEMNPNQPERYTITRQLIPRFFRSFVNSGMKDLCYVIRSMSRESQQPNGLISFENDSILQVVRYTIPCLIEAQTECKFTMEFTPYDEMLNHRIRMWHIQLRSCQEYIINEITKELQLADKNQPVTRLGLTQATIYSLSVTRILEPMQVLMGHQKMHGLNPHDTMRRTLFNHRSAMQEMQQRMSQQAQMLPPAAPEEKPKPARKRTRKGATTANSKAKKPTASPTRANPPSFPQNQMPGSFNSMTYQDVMVVGEPSMMGGDYGEEDERTISRVENTQYDPTALQQQQQQLASLGGNMGQTMAMGMMSAGPQGSSQMTPQSASVQMGQPPGSGAQMNAAPGHTMHAQPTPSSQQAQSRGPPNQNMQTAQTPVGMGGPQGPHHSMSSHSAPQVQTPTEQLTTMQPMSSNPLPPPAYSYAPGANNNWPNQPPNTTMITG